MKELWRPLVVLPLIIGIFFGAFQLQSYVEGQEANDTQKVVGMDAVRKLAHDRLDQLFDKIPELEEGDLLDVCIRIPVERNGRIIHVYSMHGFNCDQVQPVGPPPARWRRRAPQGVSVRSAPPVTTLAPPTLVPVVPPQDTQNFEERLRVLERKLKGVPTPIEQE